MVDERPHVVVVGAGLAGLTCAERLSGPVRVTLIEARDRVGGRCWSAHGWADGQVAEHGGELIESGQLNVLRLVAELGLELESRRSDDHVPGATALAGRVAPLDDVAGLPGLLAELATQHAAAVAPGRWAERRSAVELDEMTARDWLDEHVDGGTDSRLGRGVDLIVTLNLGIPTDRLSALSLHHMFIGLSDGDSSESFAFGNDSASEDAQFGDVVRSGVIDTFHVSGGNDQLASGLAARLPDGCLHLQTVLTSVRRLADGRYVLTTDSGGAHLLADRVVLATPLPPLRRVDLTDAGISARRLQAIAEVPMATHRKLLAQLAGQPGLDAAWPGLLLTDAPPTAVWDSSRGQRGTAGLLTFFSHDTWLASPDSHGPPSTGAMNAAEKIVAGLAPGLERALSGQYWLDDWAADPWSGGSYAAFAPGQYTRFADLLPTPEGGVHFAGEHTSLASFGYLDGAVGSGLRAAEEVLSSLYGAHPPTPPLEWRAFDQASLP